MQKKISLVVPVLNEQDAIPHFYKAVRNEPGLQQFKVEIVFINDGSTDKTEDVIKELIKTDPLITFVNFSRNFGKEPALFAGLDHASGDAIIPIDVDLQDPIDVVPKLIERWQSGFDVVLAKRTDRSSDSFFKRMSAQLFYQVYNKTSKPKIEENVGDFRLISRKAVEAIKQLPERNLFMKGILGWAGFKSDVIEYARAERVAGDTKFNGWKLWNLALEGVTSFSTLPLRVWTYFGVIVALTSFIYALIMIIRKIVWDNPVPGYPSLMVAILFLGGVQLIGIGVLGEYIGRIYIESKQRPRYIAKEIIKND